MAENLVDKWIGESTRSTKVQSASHDMAHYVCEELIHKNSSCWSTIKMQAVGMATFPATHS